MSLLALADAVHPEEFRDEFPHKGKTRVHTEA
jgi:hypothetical protein